MLYVVLAVSLVLQGDQKVSVHLILQYRSQVHRDFLITLYKIHTGSVLKHSGNTVFVVNLLRAEKKWNYFFV